ncbi:hypothetical protein COOONC_15900 [Cooperia oncophora]
MTHVFFQICSHVLERCYSSEQLPSLDDSRSSSPICACIDAPIYAQSWTNYDLPERHVPNIILAQERSPEAACSTKSVLQKCLAENTRRVRDTAHPIIADRTERTNSLVYPGSYFSRIVSGAKANQTFDDALSRLGKPLTMEESEEEFLTELDAQTAELQLTLMISRHR